MGGYAVPFRRGVAKPRKIEISPAPLLEDDYFGQIDDLRGFLTACYDITGLTLYQLAAEFNKQANAANKDKRKKKEAYTISYVTLRNFTEGLTEPRGKTLRVVEYMLGLRRIYVDRDGNPVDIQGMRVNAKPRRPQTARIARRRRKRKNTRKRR